MNGGADQIVKPDLPVGRVIPDDVFGILCVFAEARGEPYDGMVAVGNVVRNRAKNLFFSDGSVAGTVLHPYQFSWANTVDVQRIRVFKATWREVETAARAWFESEFNEVVPGALWYHAESVAPNWAKSQELELIRRIGRHLFFRRARTVPA